jgi:RNA-directed DNA polymerase
MAAQQLQFEIHGGRLTCTAGEAREGEGPVRQVTAASGAAEPAVGVTMEEVVERRNLQRALKRVCANQGSPGLDGMTVDQLKDHLRVH